MYSTKNTLGLVGGVEISKEETWDDIAEAFGVAAEFLEYLDNGGAVKKNKGRKSRQKKRVASRPSLPAFDSARVEISDHAIRRLIERSGRTNLDKASAEKWARELLAQSKEEQIGTRSSGWGRTLRQWKHTIPARYFVVSSYRFVVTRHGERWVVRTIESRSG